MSTEINTKDGTLVALRYYGGVARGTIVQLEIAEFEYPDWKDIEVAEERSSGFMTLEAWLATQKATVLWDSAARRNEQARELRSGRFAETPSVERLVAVAQMRARFLTRMSLSVEAGGLDRGRDTEMQASTPAI